MKAVADPHRQTAGRGNQQTSIGINSRTAAGTHRRKLRISLFKPRGTRLQLQQSPVLRNPEIAFPVRQDRLDVRGLQAAFLAQNSELSVF